MPGRLSWLRGLSFEGTRVQGAGRSSARPAPRLAFTSPRR
jgi:hypothetical protein